MNTELRIQKVYPEDVDAILGLQEDIFKDLEDPSILRRNTKEMFEQCIHEPNLSIGLFDDQKLVGLTILVDASGSEEDLSLHLEQRYWKHTKSINFKLILLRKEYRGIGFQKRMLDIIEKIALDRGYNLICATVSPDNLYSKNNLLKAGYIIDHSEKKYGGLVRNVCVKKIERNEQEPAIDLTKSIIF